MVIAHIAGIPVEETLLALAPVGATGLGVWFAQVARRLRRSVWSRHAGGAK